MSSLEGGPWRKYWWSMAKNLRVHIEKRLGGPGLKASVNIYCKILQRGFCSSRLSPSHYPNHHQKRPSCQYPSCLHCYCWSRVFPEKSYRHLSFYRHFVFLSYWCLTFFLSLSQQLDARWCFWFSKSSELARIYATTELVSYVYSALTYMVE